MPTLRHLSQRLILSGFRLSVRKWQKIPAGEFIIDIRQKLHCGIADIYQIDQHFDPFAAAHHVIA